MDDSTSLLPEHPMEKRLLEVSLPMFHLSGVVLVLQHQHIPPQAFSLRPCAVQNNSARNLFVSELVYQILRLNERQDDLWRSVIETRLSGCFLFGLSISLRDFLSTRDKGFPKVSLLGFDASWATVNNVFRHGPCNIWWDCRTGVILWSWISTGCGS